MLCCGRTEYTEIQYKILFEKLISSDCKFYSKPPHCSTPGDPIHIIFVINVLTQHLANSYVKPNVCQKSTIPKHALAHFEKLKESKKCIENKNHLSF